MSAVRPPTHIALPPPPVWHDFATDPPSPFAQFYTPPSSPAPSPNIFYTPPTSPFHDTPTANQPPAPAPPPPPPAPAPVPAPAPLASPTDDHFPVHVDLAIDLGLDDDGLSTLEKIYLYSRSRASFHRVFIIHALPEYLQQVTPQEAVEYVQPLLSGLAMDSDELVKEALAAELVPVIWWFFTYCQIIPDDLKPEEAYASSSTTVTISVQAFTPILGTLLLSSNPLVGGAARIAVVDLLSRMRKADDRESGAIHRHHPPHSPGELHHPWELAQAHDDEDEDDDTPLVVGLFGRHERAMFTQEILQQVVIGMARLDVQFDAEFGQQTETEDLCQGPMELDRSNPYFPPSPASPQSQSHANHAARYSALAVPESSVSPRFTHPANSSQSFSPGTEFPPTAEHQSAALQGRQQSPVTTGAHATLPPSSALHGPEIDDNDDLDGTSYDEDEEQAAMGRLSSMSLMAAVTANGTLEEATQRAFVKEVERVGRDPVYWVRREASFALGALAKVVPEEVVLDSLLPLFNTLRWDPVWHVRHSVLFALPAILSRLPPAQRRIVALETITTLSGDQNATVRSGVLEALGEVIHTFHEDQEGPPQRLIDLFLGRREGQHRQQLGSILSPSDSFYDDPKRHLICAFNFPAVALTLGGHRWAELKDVYRKIHADDSPGVRHTFAASLGELAKIIGAENARRDLVDIWRSTMKSDDEEVRSSAIKSTTDFIGVVGKKTGIGLLESLLTSWNEGTMRGWRERGLVMQNLVSWVALIGLDSASLGRGFLVKALEDNVAAVRETAISIVPDLYSFCSSTNMLSDILHDLQKLATSSNYRRRMTFIACQQSLFTAVAKNGQPLISCDDDFLRSVADLASDTIEGVRIGVSRFAALIHGSLIDHSRTIPSVLHDLIHQLSQDSSHEVRSYVAELSIGNAAGDGDASLASSRRSRKRRKELATFSRPPAAPSYSSSPNSNQGQDELSSGITTDLDRTFSGSSGEVNSISSSDYGSLGSPQTGVWSSSSTPESIHSADAAGSTASEGSKHFSDPPKTLVASVSGVC